MRTKRILIVLLALAMILLAAACGNTNSNTNSNTNGNTNNSNNTNNVSGLADGTYTADFKTDSSMFHVNEEYKGKGTLTVKNGEMTIHVVMPSKNVVNLFYGLAENAKKDGAQLIQPTTEKVKYSDGTEDEVYAFDIPVPYLDEEFDCALIGTKGKWYDHKVSVSNPEAIK